MKKWTLVFVTIFISTQCLQAQTTRAYKAFKVTIGMGKVIDFAHDNGGVYYWEPSYTIAQKYKLGINLEYANRYMKNISSAAYMFDYYIKNLGEFRPFAGVGIGTYHVVENAGCGGGPATVSTVRNTNPTAEKFRLGFDLEFVHFAIEYNLIQKTYVSDVDASGKTLATAAYDNAYMGIKLGINIGGGLKKQTKP
jgi:outer membrane protein W